MNDIHGITSLVASPTHREPSHRPDGGAADTSNVAVLDDRVEISELAGFLHRLTDLPESQARRIVRIRQEVLDGTYMTADKLDIAAERLLEDITRAA